MKNLQELERKYAELGKEIELLKSKNKDKEIFKFLNDCLEGCEVNISDNAIIYKKEKTLFLQDKENKYFYIEYSDIWEKIVCNYSMDYKEIQSILDEWLEDTLDLKGYKTNFQFTFLPYLL